VGADHDDGGRGSAFIFIRDENSWSQQAKLTAFDADTTTYSVFGTCVSLSGDYALVGLSNSSNAGAAYIFKRDGTIWNHQAKLIAFDCKIGNFFGSSVSISGDYSIVGAYAMMTKAPFPARRIYSKGTEILGTNMTN